MLLKQETLKGIENGTITLAYRRWRRPTVKTGGTLLTSIGQLTIQAVDLVTLKGITDAEAVAAGFSNLASLRSQLLKRAEGDIYRIQLSYSGPDPRIALREEIPVGPALEQIVQRLQRLDARGQWTRRVLAMLSERPGENSAILATDFGIDRADFKLRVRKLKKLGLTESLAVGYRLSPRGEAVLSWLEDYI